MTTATETRILPLAELKPGPGNPRQTIDESSEAFEELVASIAEHGVLQPLLVGPKTNGAHPIIAGHRRHLAAKKAKVAEVPVLIRELAGGTRAAAITENVVREDLSPVEEAEAIAALQKERGLNQDQVAKALGKSTSWVRERLRLLALPEKARAGYATHAVAFDTLAPIEAIAKVSPPVAEALVASVEKGELRSDDLRPGSIVDTLDWLERKTKGKVGDTCLVDVRSDNYGGRGFAAEELPVPAKVRKELAAAVKALPDKIEYGYRSRGFDFRFGSSSYSAAKAFGCLLTIKGKNRWGNAVTSHYITDREFLADQARQLVEKEHKDRERTAKAEKTKGKSNAKSADAEAKAKAKRKQELDEEAKARQSAHSVNLELGSRLRKDLAVAKFGMTEARLLVALALEHDSDGLAARGAYVDEALHEEIWNKAKTRLKVEPSPRGPCAEALSAEIEKAKTPEALLGVLLRHLVAAKFSDPTVTVQSKRVGTTTPGAGLDYYGRQAECAALIDQLALDYGVLPQPMRDVAEQEAKDG